ncbi:MAG TPA: S8 family serine peptidase [Spirochaetota bacterium]|nr:S8 family serine peptidase [Spirochaetota bacterium]HSA15348.1 S8 family serine peptidase [Spirochaetota bacterium]
MGISNKTRRMKLLVSLPLVAVMLIAGIRAAQLSLISSKALMNHAEGEILVMFRQGATLKKKMALMVRIGGQEYQDLSFRSMTRVVLEKGRSIPEALELCRKSKSVAYAQMNYIYRAQSVPNDPQYAMQFAAIQHDLDQAENGEHPYNPPVEKADLEQAWDIIRDCGDITVAVADTGINYLHQDLRENMWDGSGAGFSLHGYDFVDDDDNPMDMNGHGTGMAGVIGAAGNNGTGLAGVCWEINLMAVRVLDESGKGTTADIVQGITFAADNGANIITMGFGAEIPGDRAMAEALDLALENDIVAVAAAGNGDQDGTGRNIDRGGPDGDAVTSFYPCAFRHENIVCAASLDEDGAFSKFSNYGRASVDVAAQGSGLYTTLAGEHETIADDMESQWVMNGGWSSDTVDLGFGSFRMLMNPETWDEGKYADGVDDRAYKIFNLSGYDSAVVSFYGFVNTETGNDRLNIMVNPAGTDPFSEGTRLDSITGKTGDSAFLFSYGLSGLMSQSSVIGMQFISDEKGADSGIGIFRFEISGLRLGPDSYGAMEAGTSQAAAYLAGVAAMVRSLNPEYGARDTIRALLGGGNANPDLEKKTSSGKESDIYGSLLFIDKPAGLAATRKK